MSELINVDEEFNWEEEMEKSLKPIHIGKRVTGTVLSVNNTEVYVDLGTKQQGVIPAGELTNDPSLKPEDVVKVGDELDLLVLKTNDQDGVVTLSKKKVDAAAGFEKIQKMEKTATNFRRKQIIYIHEPHLYLSPLSPALLALLRCRSEQRRERIRSCFTGCS